MGIRSSEINRLSGEQSAAHPAFLQEGWVIANHILVSFHVAFISSVLVLPSAAGTKSDVLRFIFVSPETLVSALFAACSPLSDSPAPMGATMVVETNVAIPMRDGVVLRADVYRPPGDGPFPVLLYRTPYGKQFAVESYQTHVSADERGYAVVLQDVRGRYASDGLFVPYRNEGSDGYDTIEWAAAQPWSNGDIGTFGLSYPGAVQWLAWRRR